MNTSWSGARTSFPAATRRAILRRDPQCTLRLEGCTGDSEEADHIISWPDAQALGWTEHEYHEATNGRGVCRSCHRIRTLAQIAAGRAAYYARRSTKRPPKKHPGLK